MKKKILILMKSMGIGGAERSLLNMLYMFDYDLYDVHLFLFNHKGEFLNYIPNKVKVLPEIQEYHVFDDSIKNLIINRKFLYILGKFLGKINLKIKNLKNLNKNKNPSWLNQQYINEYIVPLLPNISNDNYDVAINYLGVPNVLINKVNSNIKISWIHTDYDQILFDKNKDIKLYNSIDKIVHVSQACKDIFVKYYPQFKKKTIVIENMLSKELIFRQANEYVPQEYISTKFTKLLSIGRFTDAKNFESIPEIAYKLYLKGIKFRWYIIGFGPTKNEIEKKIKLFNMQENVIILGKKTNPYPYIKHCDIYIQPSKYEGKSVAVREAQMLLKPVVITNYSTASSQLENGYDGIILPLDTDKFASGLYEFLINKKLQIKIIQNLKSKNYENKEEIEKLYKIIKGKK